jgi:Porin subfamily
MKLVKSLLLGSAAGLFAVAGAQAADLPVRKAAPVDYVRVCSTYGAGFFYIPGTDTCLRISGFVDGEMQYQSREEARDDFDTFGMRGRFRLNFDARQPTEFGLLRAYIRMDLRRESGVYQSGGESVGLTGTGFVGGSTTDFTRLPDMAYVQWGGLTAGRAQSFFDFFTADDIYTTMRTTSDTKTALFAYTASFGGGFSATLSLEDQAERRLFAGPFDLVDAGLFPGTAIPFIGPEGFVNTIRPEGIDFPDLVANVRIDQAWGAAQLSGALHEVTALNTFVSPLTGVFSNGDEELGWAIQAGVMFKLPFLAPGDQLWLNAAYSDGAGAYNGLPGTSTLERFTSVRVAQTDAFVDVNGNIQTTEVFSIAGKFLHYWLPNLRSNFFAGYADINYGGEASILVTGSPDVVGGAFNAGFLDTRIFEVGANLIWTPVKNLDIGVEAVYRNIDVKGQTINRFAGGTFGPAGEFVAPPVFRTISDDDVIEARLRVRRDF